MEVLNPNEIGVKISTLIFNANKYFYAITPYLQIVRWKKIRQNIEKARERGVNIKFFIRDIYPKEEQYLMELDIPIFKIENLHSKFYMNENEVIVSSMNLYEYSDTYSNEIGLYFNDGKSYSDILSHFNKYINNIYRSDNENIQTNHTSNQSINTLSIPDLQKVIQSKLPIFI